MPAMMVRYAGHKAVLSTFMAHEQMNSRGLQLGHDGFRHVLQVFAALRANDDGIEAES